MPFPTIPTVAAGRILFTLNTAGGATKTFPDLSSLTKQAGDLLLAIIVEYDGNSTNAEFSSWGGSFTEFADFAGTATMAIGAAYKWSTGSETGTFTVNTADATTNDSVLILISIPGAHASTPPEAGGFATGTAAAANPAAFNPTNWDAEDTLWIAVGGSGEDATTGSFTGVASAPTNYGSLANSGITADVVGGVDATIAFRQLNAASEDVGAFSVDTSNARNAALVIAVRPLTVLAGMGVAQGQAAGNIALVQNSSLAGLGVAQGQASTVITFPVGVIGGIHAESNNRGSPIIDTNGNIYTITELAVLDPKPCMRKSTNGGTTWNEVDAANRPTHDDLESLWIAQHGTVIHVLYQRSGTMRVSYAKFNMSDAATNPDTWQVVNEQVHLPTTAPANQAVSLAVRSNGDLLAFYRTDPVSGFQRLAWRKKPSGGSWSAETQVDVTASTNFTQVAVVVGASDKVHILYKDDTNSNVLHKSLTSADVPSLPEIVNDNPTTTDDQMMATPPIYVDMAGVERIFVAWKRLSNGFLVGAPIDDDGVPGAEESISNVAIWEDPPVTTSEQAVATLAVDPATDKIYAIYADNTTHDVWKVERNGTWGTNTEILNNVEAQYLAAMVLTHSSGNGGAKVLGIIYDNNPTGVQDAGVPTYTQIELSAGSTTLAGLGIAQAQATRGSGASTVALVQENDGNVGATRQTQITATLPNNLQTGNFITVKLTSNNVPTFTPPDGTWTSIKREVNGTSHVVESFRHPVQAGEVGAPGSWIFTIGATARSLSWHASELSGVDGTAPVDGTPTSVVAGTTSVALPAITVSAGALVEIATAWSSGAGAFTTVTEPTGYTELVDQHTTINPAATDSSQHVSYEQYPTAGSTGTITATSSASSGVAAIAYAIKPSSGAIVLEEITGGAINLTGLGVAQGQEATDPVLIQVHELAGLGVAQAQEATDPVLTQDHNLAGLNVAQGQTTTVIALTQDHTLVGLNVAQAQSTTNITLELPSQAINVRPTMMRMVSGRLFSMTTTIQVLPVPPVDTVPTLAGMGVAQGQETTDPTLVQVHVLAGLGAGQGQTTTNIALIQAHVLAGLGVAQAQAATAPTLAVAHNLLGLGVGQAHDAENVILGLPGQLTVPGVAQGQATTTIALTQVHVLAGLNVAQAQATADPTLTVQHNLAGLGVAQGQATTNIGLSVIHHLLGLNVAQAQSSTVIALTQVHVLAGLGVAQGQATADPTLVVYLMGLNVAQGQTTATINLTQVHVLAGLNVSHAQVAGPLTLGVAGALTGLGVAQAQATLDPVLERVYNLLGLGIAQAQATADPSLAVIHNLLGLGVAQPSAATALVLIQIHVLVGMGVITQQQVEAVVLGLGAMPLVRDVSGNVVKRYGSGAIRHQESGGILR